MVTGWMPRPAVTSFRNTSFDYVVKKKPSTAGSSLTHTGYMRAGFITAGILPSAIAWHDDASWTSAFALLR